MNEAPGTSVDEAARGQMHKDSLDLQSVFMTVNRPNKIKVRKLLPFLETNGIHELSPYSHC